MNFDITTIDDDTRPVVADGEIAEMELLRERLADLISGTGPDLQHQPITHIQSRTEVGAEALARFPGSVPTAEWFRTAHALGVGVDLELRILHEVVQTLHDRRSGFCSVNLSPTALLDPRCLDILMRARGGELVIEITDQTVMPRLALLRRRLDEVRDLGVRVAVHVSEFGTETMQLLTLARPDVIKLDPPLTAALAAGRARSTTAANFFTYCRQAGVFVVAVGVETREQLVALHDVGVDAFQGFFVLRSS